MATSPEAPDEPLRRLLLIMDMDETMLHATEKPLAERACDFCIGAFYIHKRPHLDQFLQRMQLFCDLAVWSAGSACYVEPTVQCIFEGHPAPVFTWSRDRCTYRFDGESFEHYWLKDLQKVKRRGFPLARTLIVEDTPKKVERHYGNAIYIREFLGQPNDDELLRLAAFIETLALCPNVRRIEKRFWRNGQ